MERQPVTVISTDISVVDAACDPDDVRLDPDQLPRALGWELKPEGLCHGDKCVPVDVEALRVDGQLSLRRVADALRLRLVVDGDRRVAAVTDGATAAGQTLAEGRAPDFELPDLEGHPVSLATGAGKKKLLVAWASW